MRQVALAASKENSVAFHVSDASSNTGTSSLVEHDWFTDGSHVIEVSTTTLDEIFAETECARFRLVKIDVERAEDAVLTGARALLSRQLVDYFIIELRTGTTADKLLADAGYEGFRLDEVKQRLVRLNDVPRGRFGDYLFRRPGLPLSA